LFYINIPEALKKKLFIQLKCNLNSIQVNTNERLLDNIFINLIENAVKFTEKGEITVSVDVIKKENQDFIECRIIDSGIGIPEEYHTKIFEEFRQVSEGLSRQFDGTGLGLTLSKKWIERLNGSIYVESTPNIGSIFTVLFPQRITSENT
jgi:signal transduction histidine kinase